VTTAEPLEKLSTARLQTMLIALRRLDKSPFLEARIIKIEEVLIDRAVSTGSKRLRRGCGQRRKGNG
jgi:hypothetical protein